MMADVVEGLADTMVATGAGPSMPGGPRSEASGGKRGAAVRTSGEDKGQHVICARRTGKEREDSNGLAHLGRSKVSGTGSGFRIGL